MAHEISINANSQTEAMFAYRPAWHGIGTVVQQDVRPMEALKIASLNWAVRKEALYRTNLDEIPDRAAVCRTDNGNYLGTVGKRFMPVQNIEQASFIEAICGEGNAVVESCGALRGGRRTFWAIKQPNALTVGNEDLVERFLIVANGNDGSLSFKAFWSPVRVVCQNTLNAALRHTGSIMNRITEARHVLGLANEYYAEIGEQFNRLSKVSLDDKGFSSYLNELLPLSQGGTPADAIAVVRDQLTNNWRSGRGVEVTSPSMWRAYNAVTEFVSHQRASRGKSELVRSENRFDAVLLGAGRALQQRAFDVATRMSGMN
jgi:phage/plasmid-like protein (TIGR03299 family)